MLADVPMPPVLTGRCGLLLSLRRLVLVPHRRAVVTCAGKTSRYYRFKENAELFWDAFFTKPPLYFDFRASKGNPRFADFQLQEDRNTALYIEGDTDIEQRLQELDALTDPALKACRTPCSLRAKETGMPANKVNGFKSQTSVPSLPFQTCCSSHACPGRPMQPEVVPDADEFFRQHFEEGRQLVDLRPRKQYRPKLPDFQDRLTGLGIWLSQCSPWVLERLNSQDADSIPDKVHLLGACSAVGYLHAKSRGCLT